MNLLLITPLYPPSVGGAATYYSLLLKAFEKIDKITNVSVLTEYIKKEKIIERKGKTLMLRFLYPRSGLTNRNIITRFNGFLITQIQLFMLLPVLLFLKIHVMHFHTTRAIKIMGKYRNPMFELFLKLLKLFGIKIVADARDLFSIPTHDGCFDKLICASENIYGRALEIGINHQKCIHIPIIFEKVDLENDSIPQSIKEVNPYICFVGDVVESKGIYELIEGFNILILLKTFYNYYLVIVGANREGKKLLQTIEKNPRIKYLGSKSHSKTLRIIQYSELLILPSKSEGLPRVCLEGIALGKKVICPPGIPEFDKHLSEFVLDKIEPKHIASKINEVLKFRATPKYPLEEHALNLISKRIFKVYNQGNI